MNLRSHATRLGVLDIGSNTVHMLIVDAAPGARPEPEASVKSTVRLMQYLKEDGTIRKAGVEAVLEAVQKAMKLAEGTERTCWRRSRYPRIPAGKRCRRCAGA